MKTGAPSPTLHIADVGTGSGCIAVALAHELPHAKIIATDISVPALAVARHNATRHQVADRIEFVEADLFKRASRESPITTRESHLFDLIVSNPPYIAHTDAASLPAEVRDHEPHSALFGGPRGVEIYSRLIQQSGALLKPGGFLVLELGYDSATAVRKMFHMEHCWANISITDDLAGIPRVIAAERV
jgi:release factor glutamine methyltransferase